MDYGMLIAYASGGAAIASFIIGWMVGASGEKSRVENVSREIEFMKAKHKLEVQRLELLLAGLKMGQNEKHLLEVIDKLQREETDRLVAEGKLIRFTS